MREESDYTSLRQWFLTINEPIKAIVLSTETEENRYELPDPTKPSAILYASMDDIPTEVLDRKFNPGFGGAESVPFYVYTATRVYFVVTYDGSEWMGWVPRHPNANVRPEHHGGG